MAEVQRGSGSSLISNGRQSDEITQHEQQREGLLSSADLDTQPSLSAPKDAHAEARSTTSAFSTNEKTDDSEVLPSRKLQPFRLVVYLACAYTAVATFAWSITCILVHRPVTTRHYGPFSSNDSPFAERRTR